MLMGTDTGAPRCGGRLANMYRLCCAILAGSLIVWGCSSATRDRWMHVFFEIPSADSGAAAAPDRPTALELHEAFPTAAPASRFASVHPPFLTRECGECHDAARRMEVREDLLNTCESCHDDYFADSIEHFPVAEGQCLECHDPHRSDFDHLLKLPVYDACIECHDPPEDLSQPAHAGPDAKSCTACHDPHFGAAPMLKTKPSPTVPPEPEEKKAPDENEALPEE